MKDEKNEKKSKKTINLKLKIKLKEKELETESASNINIHKRKKSPFIRRNNSHYDKYTYFDLENKKNDKIRENNNIDDDEEKKHNKRYGTPKKEKRNNSKKHKKDTQPFNIKEELKDILVNKSHNIKVTQSSNNLKTSNNDLRLNRFDSNDAITMFTKETKEEINTRIDKIINKILLAKEYKPNTEIDLLENEINWVLVKAYEIIKNQPVFIELDSPINICGDVHGQFYDLLRLFNYVGFPPKSNFLFLGDYVDRGKNSLETIVLLLCYKIKYPENFFMLRGNHESDNINKIYGFYDECKRRFNIKMWKKFNDLFNIFPITAIIKDKILCMHGGLSPDLLNFDLLKKIFRIFYFIT